jgi:hypothetical protein
VATAMTNGLHAELVAGEDTRACREISETACREVPRNFFLLIGRHVLTRLGDAIANPKTTLTWMMDAIAAPVELALVLWKTWARRK